MLLFSFSGDGAVQIRISILLYLHLYPMSTQSQLQYSNLALLLWLPVYGLLHRAILRPTHILINFLLNITCSHYRSICTGQVLIYLKNSWNAALCRPLNDSAPFRPRKRSIMHIIVKQKFIQATLLFTCFVILNSTIFINQLFCFVVK